MGDQEEELKVKKKELQIQQRQLIDTAEQRTKLDDLKLDQGSLNSELRSAKKEIKFLSFPEIIGFSIGHSIFKS